MKTEDEELLLKDLCTRLPYGVICTDSCHGDNRITEIDVVNKIIYFDNASNYTIIEDIKPYLRPMSSMTKEERKEIEILIKENRPNPYGIINNKGIDNLLFSVSITSGVLIDWLNAHHFDYRGLIEKGLALEAPEGMYDLNK